MKTINRSVIMILVFAAVVFAQHKMFVQKAAEEKILSDESYPIDARPFLERFNKVNGIDEAELAKEKVLNKTNKTAWNFVVGSQKTWWASDFVSNGFYSTPSTCRAVGINCYIFVEDSLWIDGVNGRVSQTAVDQVKNAFDSATPIGSINPSQGIYQNDVDTYGNPPNVDGDSKIIIFILNIKDGYNGTGGYVAGYFHSVNESLTFANSNQAEIYYLDGNPLNLKSSGGVTTGMKTTAHEFQHMIHWNYIPNAETFFNEGWSLAAEVINGYSLYNQSYFLGESNHYLLDWRSSNNTAVLKDYSRAARFALYLKEQFGTGIFKSYLNNSINGATGLNIYFASVGNRTFSSVLVDWWLANFLNENVSNAHPEWIYTYTPMTKVTSNVTYSNPNVSNGSTNGLYKYSAEYITFNSGKNLKINFNTTANGYIQIKAIKVSANTKVIENVTPGIDYSVPDFGTTYSSITFMVYHNNGNDGFTGPFGYSFNSSGTAVQTVQEIAYDSTEPVGFISLLAGDSVAVNFDAVQGGKLDSIRVAIRNLVPINGRVLEYLGLAARLGGKLYANFTATSNLSQAPQVINPGGEYPYPQPYPNWTTVDLRANNISTDKNFVIEFPYEDPYPDKNRILATYHPSTGVEHTILYRSSTSTWGYSGVSGKTDYSWAVLIRAYVSYGSPTGVKENIELLPSSFSLEQNYPNPFNPETVIRYQLPEGGLVTLKVYDVLGREVAILINEFQQAGAYNSTFSISNSQLSSGVYFYRLTAGNKVETKKMILLK